MISHTKNSQRRDEILLQNLFEFRISKQHGQTEQQTASDGSVWKRKPETKLSQIDAKQYGN